MKLQICNAHRTPVRFEGDCVEECPACESEADEEIAILIETRAVNENVVLSEKVGRLTAALEEINELLRWDDGRYNEGVNEIVQIALEPKGKWCGSSGCLYKPEPDLLGTDNICQCGRS